MIDVDRTALEDALRSGSNRAGAWHICRVDGRIYWHAAYGVTGHEGHADLRVPALYPDGSGSLYRSFCVWTRNLAPERRCVLLSLAQGTVGPENTQGTAYAVPCILRYFLTVEEKAAWEASVQARLTIHAEGCLQALNAPHGRPRYRFRAYPANISVAS